MLKAKKNPSNKKLVSKQKSRPKSRKTEQKKSGKTRQKKPVNARIAVKSKPSIKPAMTVKIPPSKDSGKKRHGLTVISRTNAITEEQKIELKKLHIILSDPFVRQMLIEVGGESALEIVRNFYGSHSDEELSKNLSLRISDVRATLNRLHNEGLVKYARMKDTETGWYSYLWTLNKEKIVEWVARFTTKAVSGNGKEGVDHYFCPTCGLASIIEFPQAHDCEFKCQKCNKPLEFVEETHFSEINELLGKK